MGARLHGSEGTGQYLFWYLPIVPVQTQGLGQSYGAVYQYLNDFYDVRLMLDECPTVRRVARVAIAK